MTPELISYLFHNRTAIIETVAARANAVKFELFFLLSLPLPSLCPSVISESVMSLKSLPTVTPSLANPPLLQIFPAFLLHIDLVLGQTTPSPPL